MVGDEIAWKLTDPFAELESSEYPELALSLYLPALQGPGYDPRRPERVFRELLHQRLSDPFLGEVVVAALKREREPVLAHLERREPAPGHGLAVFACTPAGLLTSWQLPGDAAPEVHVARTLALDPVRRALEAQPPCLVVAADSERALVYGVLLGEEELLAELQGLEVKHHRQGGWSAKGIQRQEEGHMRQNLARVAGLLAHQDLRFYRRIHLAGPVAARSELRRLLPEHVRARLGPDLAGGLFVPATELARSLGDEVRSLYPQPSL